MKIKFEGTYEEFFALFRAQMNSPIDATSQEFQPSEKDAPPVPEDVTVLRLKPRAVPDLIEDQPPIDSPTEIRVPALTDITRRRVTKNLSTLLAQWLVGWEQPEYPHEKQPDRVELLRNFATTRDAVPLLQMAYEMGALQRVIEAALAMQTSWSSEWPPQPTGAYEWLDLYDRISGHLVQISHICYPDLEGTHAYSSAWKRDKAFATREED